MFERVDNTPAKRGGKAHSKYGSAVSVLSDDVEEYKFQHMESGQQGTRVPKSTRTGGIQGSKNSHGAIVMGDKITVKPDVGFISLGELEPVVGLEDEVITDPEVEPVAVEEVEEEVWDELDEQTIADMEELQTYEPPVATDIPTRHIPLDVAQIKKELEVKDALSVKKIRVKMSGSFGTYRGKYTYMHETDELVVLLYDVSDPVYSPPASEEPFIISCGKHSHEVYFAGIEFELDFLQQGIQIFVKTE